MLMSGLSKSDLGLDALQPGDAFGPELVVVDFTSEEFLVLLKFEGFYAALRDGVLVAD